MTSKILQNKTTIKRKLTKRFEEYSVSTKKMKMFQRL